MQLKMQNQNANKQIIINKSPIQQECLQSHVPAGARHVPDVFHGAHDFGILSKFMCPCLSMLSCLLLQKWFWQKKCATNGLHRGVKPGDTEMQPAILCNVFKPCAMRYDAKTLCNLHYDAMPHAMPSIPCVDLM